MRTSCAQEGCRPPGRVIWDWSWRSFWDCCRQPFLTWNVGLLWVTVRHGTCWIVQPGVAPDGYPAGGRCLPMEGVRVAGSDGPGDGARWRVFLSHTSELRDFPPRTSYVAAVERAISAAGHVIVDMAGFPAASQPAAQLCADRVRGCDVYVGVLGTRYGSPVRDRPEVSYTELEFDTATEAGLDRLVFLLDTGAADVGIPLSALIDLDFGARQEAFRRRVRDSGLVTASFASPASWGSWWNAHCRSWPGPGGVPAARSRAGRLRRWWWSGRSRRSRWGSSRAPSCWRRWTRLGRGRGSRWFTR